MTLPNHLWAPEPKKTNSNAQYVHLSFFIPIELVFKDRYNLSYSAAEICNK